ncbi:MAG: hypothetical protein OEY97_04065 [Nitrospirota bacterium]|nr:hypothetical protein [Nitrospirota bacterium]
MKHLRTFAVIMLAFAATAFLSPGALANNINGLSEWHPGEMSRQSDAVIVGTVRFLRYIKNDENSNVVTHRLYEVEIERVIKGDANVDIGKPVLLYAEPMSSMSAEPTPFLFIGEKYLLFVKKFFAERKNGSDDTEGGSELIGYNLLRRWQSAVIVGGERNEFSNVIIQKYYKYDERINGFDMIQIVEDLVEFIGADEEGKMHILESFRNSGDPIRQQESLWMEQEIQDDL